jgi:carboxybiotin decarboxylase
MAYVPRPVSRRALILFPIVVTLMVGLLVPAATLLITMLMLGNLLRQSAVVERLSKSAQQEIVNVATLFLGVTIGSTMNAAQFLRWEPMRPAN